MRVQRVAIIGCGFFSANHVHAWRSLEGAELVALCDQAVDRARIAAEAVGVPYFEDAGRMIAEVKPDVVDIVTTAQSHRALASLCAAQGVPAIIQKPLAFSLAEAADIVSTARRSGTIMMVHENFRFQAPIREVARILRSGIIGTPHYCRVGFRCGHDIFAGQPYLKEDERLVLTDLGVHVFDVARLLIGEIEQLSCQTQRVRPDVRGEDMASALVRFASGAMGLVECSWSSFVPDDPFPETLVQVEGSNGAIVLDRDYRISVRSGATVERFSAEPATPEWGERPWHVVQDSVTATCRHWLETGAIGAEPETSVSDNLRTLAAVEAAYRSAAADGAMVSVTDVLAEVGFT